MHRWLRNLHLFTGLFSCFMVFQYGVSTMFMSHRAWFNNDPIPPVESSFAVAPDQATSARALGRALMDRHGLSGEIRQGRETQSGYSLRIVRPGVAHEVDYDRSSGQAKVKTRTSDFRRTMVGIHHQGGIQNEDWVNQGWGWIVALGSVGLIILALSGIYLWFKLYKERLSGGVILVVSLLYSWGLMIALRSA